MRPGRPTEQAAGRPAWVRHGLYAAGTGSLLVLSLLASLAVWTVLPWALLGWSPTVVVSDSMRPAVRTGDVVLLRPADPHTVGRGTVVVYVDQEGARVLHRVVHRAPDGRYVLQGDANPTPDSAPVVPDRVRGAAVLLVPWIGVPSVWLGRGDTPALVGAALALLVCLRLVSYAFDPAYEPWADGDRVLPVRVLLDADEPQPPDLRGPGLLPPALHDVVLARLAEQAAATGRRHADLVAALS